MNEAKLREVLMRFLMEFGPDAVNWLRVSKTEWYAWGNRQLETGGLLTALDNAGWLHETYGADGIRRTRITDKALAFIKGDSNE